MAKLCPLSRLTQDCSRLCNVLNRGSTWERSMFTLPQPGMRNGRIDFLAATGLTASHFFKASRREFLPPQGGLTSLF